MYKHVLHFAVLVLVLMCSVRVLASDVEEVIVIGANIAPVSYTHLTLPTKA